MGNPLVETAASFAECPVLADPPKSAPARMAEEIICRNAIHSSPAATGTHDLRAEAPIAIPPPLPGFLSWPGLLLERTEHQGPREHTETFGAAPQRQFRTPKLMRTERLSQRLAVKFLRLS